MSTLRADVLDALDRAGEVLPAEAGPALEALRARMDEPLRVAVAGRVKAGKSTLVNALLGERLAATDVGEQTRLVTWFRQGHQPLVRGVGPDGSSVDLSFRRIDSRLTIDVGVEDVERLDHLEVRWPNPVLGARTLVDTPGLGSTTEATGARTRRFLGVEDDGERPVDAVLYLLRHAHVDDAAMLEAFHDEQLGRASPISAVGVLSRADELAGGDLDAMEQAGRVADRYRQAPSLRRLCHTVVPVCGLLAEAAATLTEPEARALVELADADPDELATALRSVDDLRDERRRLGITAEERAVLLDRLGLFGVRTACRAVQAGARTGATLSAALRAASGIDELLGVLDGELAPRAELLSATNVLAGLGRLAEQHEAPSVAAVVERIVASHHEWAELGALLTVRSGPPGLSGAPAEEAERLLGGWGTDLATRLGRIGAAADDGEGSRAALLDAVARWQRRAENPLGSREATEVARTVVRTLEGELAALPPG
jgi:hypothetical protein